MAVFAKYPFILLLVLKSQFLQQWRTGKSPGEIRWRLTQPQIWPSMEIKKSSSTCPVPGLWAGWHKLTQTPALLLFQPGSSGLLICWCFPSAVLSISGCSNGDLPCLPGWYALYTLSSGGQKFALKCCCESFNLRTYDCFALKRLLRKKGHLSVHSCSSTKCITQSTEMQTSQNKWEWLYQEGMTTSWNV